MSAVISPGFPVEGRIFEPPSINRDNEQPRYLTFVGSLIEPETSRSRPWTRGGGIEIENPCLRYVKNFLRKGRITPLLRDTHPFIPFETAKAYAGGDPLQSGYFPQPIPENYKPLPESRNRQMVGRVALPGEQVNAILTGSDNIFDGQPRGVVEIISLRGNPYRPVRVGDSVVDAEIWEIQKAIFPDYPLLPLRLEDIKRALDDAEEHIFLRGVVADFQTSLSQFEDYALVTVENIEAMMREVASTTQGYIPRYTPMHLLLLDQLGRTRKDRQIRTQSQTGDSEIRDAMKQLIALQVEEKQANVDRLKRLGEPLEPVSETFAPSDYAGDRIDAQTMMASPEFGDAGQQGQEGTSGVSGASGQITNATSEGQEQMSVAMADSEKFECVCGREAGSKAGLLAHQRHCDAVKAQS